VIGIETRVISNFTVYHIIESFAPSKHQD